MSLDGANRSVYATSLAPQFVDRPVQILIAERDVFEAAAKGVIVTDRRPVDADRRVDGRLNVLGIHAAIARPARVVSIGPIGHGRPDGAAWRNPASGKYSGLLDQVIAPAGCGDRSHGA